MKFQLRFLDEAKNSLKKLDKSVTIRILRKLTWLAEHADSVAEEGLHADLTGYSKLREGEYRIIYKILREEGMIVVRFIGHRREVYKQR